MASSGSVFSETLQEITNTKLEELTKRRDAYEKQKSDLLAAVRAEDDPIRRLTALIAGVKSCLGVKSDKAGKVMIGHGRSRSLEVELSNMDRFLAQANTDPSVSHKMLGTWEQSLLRHLETQSLKFQYADLYGKLVTEWLSADVPDDGAADADMGEGFEDVGNAKRLESRMEWEKVVFEPARVDAAALGRYLDDLFGRGVEDKKDVFRQVERLRGGVASFEAGLSLPNQFTMTSLGWAIQGLLASDLLSDEKRDVLKDFKGNPVILSEIADVLNMRLSALDSWSWGASVPVEQRRKISGIYSVHMHEDLLQAIFLQYIGVRWSVFFKQAFATFRRSRHAWKPLRQEVPLSERRRLKYYLGPLKREPCLQTERTLLWAKDYFMSQLLSSESQEIENLEGQVVAEYAEFAQEAAKTRSTGMLVQAQSAQMPMQMQNAVSHLRSAAPRRKMARASNRMRGGDGMWRATESASEASLSESEVYDEPDGDPGPKNPMEIKQRLLHLLATEIAINTRLHGEMTAFHSTFESWNSLLPHDTVRSVLSFFGVSETWLGFFTRFLEAPLRFVDDESGAPRRRRRGTPASHMLSDVFGETTLFCLDFAVNQSTGGRLLHRLYDDFWFWSPEHDVSVRAWKTVNQFASATGTSLNLIKSGSVRVARDPDVSLAVDRSLPEGEIRWGFLRLSGRTGRFEIDQKMVDAHIDELRKQLRDRRNRSIFAFVRTWNTYASTFFASNFGLPANCFGRDHVDQMLATHERIQRQIFSTDGSSATSVVDYLRETICQRFGIADVPDGYIFFPTELGGLDLQSPFISLLQIRNSVLSSTDELFAGLEESEQDEYKRAKAAFYKGETPSRGPSLDRSDWLPAQQADRDNFFSFEEFVRYREEFDFSHGTQLKDVFGRLMQNAQEESVEPNGSITTALSALAGQTNLKVITNNWYGMDSYWKWVTTLYGPEIVERFGGLNIVDHGLLPMGMVALFRDTRVTWQG